MKAYKIGFTYLDDGFAIIPQAEDVTIARGMAVELLAELQNAVITSIQEFDTPQAAVESVQETQSEGKHYVN